MLANGTNSRTDGKAGARMARTEDDLARFHAFLIVKDASPQSLRSLLRVHGMQVVRDIPSTLPLLVADWNC